MGLRMTAVAWLERHYDKELQLEHAPAGEGTIVFWVINRGGYRMFSLKRDDMRGEPGSDAARWPVPFDEDDIEFWEDW